MLRRKDAGCLRICRFRKRKADIMLRVIVEKSFACNLAKVRKISEKH